MFGVNYKAELLLIIGFRTAILNTWRHSESCAGSANFPLSIYCRCPIIFQKTIMYMMGKGYTNRREKNNDTHTSRRSRDYLRQKLSDSADPQALRP